MTTIGGVVTGGSNLVSNNTPSGSIVGGGVVGEKSSVSALLAPKKYSLGRGVPPPIPPNKPSVPPKSGTLTAKIHAAKLEQQITWNFIHHHHHHPVQLENPDDDQQQPGPPDLPPTSHLLISFVSTSNNCNNNNNHHPDTHDDDDGDEDEMTSSIVDENHSIICTNQSTCVTPAANTTVARYYTDSAPIYLWTQKPNVSTKWSKVSATLTKTTCALSSTKNVDANLLAFFLTSTVIILL